MKKTYLITIGAATVLVLLAIWLYLLIYGTPKPVENFFTDFSFTGNEQNGEALQPVIPDESAQVNVGEARLRQLTTRPIIGLSEDRSGNEVFIRYVEAGTGHVYSINLISGVETRLSNTTIPNAQYAAFSPDGKYAAIRSGYGSNNTIELVKLGSENNSTTEKLTPAMVEFKFSETNELLFTEYTSNGMTGRSLNPETKTTRTLFTVPFQSAHIIWSNDSLTPHYVYPKASAQLNGFLYSLQSGSIKRLEISGAGLTALADSEYIVYTRNSGERVQSRSRNLTTGEDVGLTVIAEPSKCTLSKIEPDTMYCGYEEKSPRSDFPDNWYKGLITYSDRIWIINLKQGYSAQLVNPLNELGREIDITQMTLSQNEEILYFINKNDNTLWMYAL